MMAEVLEILKKFLWQQKPRKHNNSTERQEDSFTKSVFNMSSNMFTHKLIKRGHPTKKAGCKKFSKLIAAGRMLQLGT